MKSLLSALAVIATAALSNGAVAQVPPDVGFSFGIECPAGFVLTNHNNTPDCVQDINRATDSVNAQNAVSAQSAIEAQNAQTANSSITAETALNLDPSADIDFMKDIPVCGAGEVLTRTGAGLKCIPQATAGGGTDIANVTHFTAPGTYSWVVPAYKTKLRVHAWGGGGGAYTPWYNAGFGGGGGAYCSEEVTVTPGSIVTVVVGAGSSGTGGASNYRYAGSGCDAPGGLNYSGYGSVVQSSWPVVCGTGGAINTCGGRGYGVQQYSMEHSPGGGAGGKSGNGGGYVGSGGNSVGGANGVWPEGGNGATTGAAGFPGGGGRGYSADGASPGSAGAGANGMVSIEF